VYLGILESRSTGLRSNYTHEQLFLIFDLSRPGRCANLIHVNSEPYTIRIRPDGLDFRIKLRLVIGDRRDFWRLKMTQMLIQEAPATHYRGVLCHRCGQPIPISETVTRLKDQLHSFPLRCRNCKKEAIYALSDIQQCEGEPNARQVHINVGHQGI
jgi:hypothetical protein